MMSYVAPVHGIRFLQAYPVPTRVRWLNAPETSGKKMKPIRSNAFTLIELLVVLAIISLLVSILLPSLTRAKTIARIAKTHMELRGVTLAISLYRMDQKEQIPPTRYSCSTQTAYELPIELAQQNYLPSATKNGKTVVDSKDPFHSSETYKYRAVGSAVVNETTVIENDATLYVPDGFPDCSSLNGKYYNDPKTSPVRYAIWSVGPDLESPKFDIPGRLPVPNRFWLLHAGDTGVITHMEDANGMIHLSP